MAVQPLCPRVSIGLILNEDNSFALQSFIQQFFDESGFSGAQKAGDYVYFCPNQVQYAGAIILSRTQKLEAGTLEASIALLRGTACLRRKVQ